MPNPIAENAAQQNTQPTPISPMEAGTTINLAITTYADKLSQEYSPEVVEATRKAMQDNNTVAYNRFGFEKYGTSEAPLEHVELSGTQMHIVAQALKDMSEYGTGESRRIDLLLHPKPLQGPDGHPIDRSNMLPNEKIRTNIANLTHDLVVHKKMAALALDFFTNENAETSATGPRDKLAQNQDYISGTGRMPNMSNQTDGQALQMDSGRRRLLHRIFRRKQPEIGVSSQALELESDVFDPNVATQTNQFAHRAPINLNLNTQTRTSKEHNYTPTVLSPLPANSGKASSHHRANNRSNEVNRPPNRTDQLDDSPNRSRPAGIHRGERRPIKFIRSGGRHKQF